MDGQTGARTGALFVVMCLLATGLVACGNGSSPGPGASAPPPGPPPAQVAVARVVIEPSNVLLIRPGETRALVARTYAADGRELTGRTVNWASSRSSTITVDSTGVVRAAVADGSAQISAAVEGVSARPILAVAATVPADAKVFTDTDIVGEPRETSTNGPPGTPGNGLEFTLATSVAAPAVGDIVVGNGTKPVAGRVVAVETSGGGTVVRFTPGPLPDVFPSLRFDETFALTADDAIVNPALADVYDVVRTGSRFDFRPKAAASLAGLGRQKAVGTFASPPFRECESTVPFTGDSPVPFKVAAPPLFSVEFEPTVTVEKSLPGGIDRWLVHGEPQFTIEAGVEVEFALELGVECKLELLVFSPPIGGPLSLLIGGVIPVGGGLGISGQLTVAELRATTKLGTKAEVDMGLACVDGDTCSPFFEAGEPELVFEPKVELPGGDTGLDDLKLGVEIALFGYVEVALGSRLFRRLQLEALEARAGGKLEGEFALWRTQVANPDFKARYAGKAFLSATAGTELVGLARMLGVEEISLLSVEIERVFAQSPTGSVTADRAAFSAGDAVSFFVDFEADTLAFLPVLFTYNVREVVLVRRVPGGTVEVARQEAVEGRTQYRFDLVADSGGRADEYYAFVVTALLPLDVLALEIGRASVVAGVWSESVVLGTSVSRTGQVVTAANGDGRAAVAWVHSDAAPNSGHVYVAHYAPETGWAPPRQLSETGFGVFDVRIAMDDAGRIVVAWWAPVSEAVIGGQFVGFNHAPYVARYVPGTGWTAAEPLIEPMRGRQMSTGSVGGASMTPGGIALVAWQESMREIDSATGAARETFRLLARALDPQEGQWGAVRTIHSAVVTDGTIPILGPLQWLDAGGRAAVAWRASDGLRVSRSDDREAWEAPELLTSQNLLSVIPGLAGNDSGGLAVAWLAADRTRAFTRRFDRGAGWAITETAYIAAEGLPLPAGPLRLALQSDGTLHLLLRPSERVTVNGAMQTVQRIAVLTQPPGGAWDLPRQLNEPETASVAGDGAHLGIDGAGRVWTAWVDRLLGTSQFGLAEARYTPSSGWRESTMLDDSGVVQVNAAQSSLATSPAGHAIVAWVARDAEGHELRVALFQ